MPRPPPHRFHRDPAWRSSLRRAHDAQSPGIHHRHGVDPRAQHRRQQRHLLVIEGVLLRPLPYPHAERIVSIFFRSNTQPKFPLNPFDLRDFRERNRSFDSLAGITRSDFQLSGAGEPLRLQGFRITAGYFKVLGLTPAMGREFTERDELPNAPLTVILSDRTWRTRFAADPAILGRRIQLNTLPFEVV